jgi:hypothetical protein
MIIALNLVISILLSPCTRAIYDCLLEPGDIDNIIALTVGLRFVIAPSGRGILGSCLTRHLISPYFTPQFMIIAFNLVISILLSP